MKTYVKPELFYENFELSEHIADCGWEWTAYINDPVRCYAVGDPSWGNEGNIFEGNNSCSGTLEGICYTNGTRPTGLFNS